ncbi:MAG: hypothetical protein LUC50_02240 [Ruminococcus sp.]|nr:hypothetical protein [Ruminococcus sp.]
MILEFFQVWICIILFQCGRRCQNVCLTRYVKTIGEGKDEEEIKEEKQCNIRGTECGFLLSAIAIIGMAVLLFQ